MRRSVVWQLTMVFIFMAGCTSGDVEPGLLHLKVDFAAPSGKDDPKPIAGTTKDGWWHWVIPDWDFYRSDLTWEDGKGRYPEGGPGIAGSGVHAAVTCHYEGIMTMYVAGMRRYLAGGIQPEKKPIHEPLCNTWIAGSDKQGTGDVKQTLEAKNVVIQQVKTDAELKPSIIEFTTDGSPLVVVYAGGCCKSDDLRRHRKGGYAVLNAFELIQLSAATAQEK